MSMQALIDRVEHRRRGWIWILLHAAATLALGVVAIVFPLAAGLSVGWILGVTLVVAGVLQLVLGASWIRRSVVDVVLGVLTMGLGVVTLVMPLIGSVALVWMTGAWLVVAAAFGMIAAVRAKGERLWLILLAFANLILGGMLLFSSPEMALLYLAAAVGISLIIRSLFLASLAVAARKRRVR